MARSKALKVTEAEFVGVVNEWWRRYTDDPAAFGHTAQVVKEILEAQLAGVEPTIGQRDLAFFKRLLDELRAVNFGSVDALAKRARKKAARKKR